MLKFPTLELLDTQIGLIFALPSWGGNIWDVSCKAVGPLKSSVRCSTYLVNLLCSIQQIKITLRVRCTLQNTKVVGAQMHLHDPKINCYVVTVGSCGHGSELKPIIWHNHIAQTEDERFQTLFVKTSPKSARRWVTENNPAGTMVK
jgi:hypothetical protein